jgi:hypothetical protein
VCKTGHVRRKAPRTGRTGNVNNQGVIGWPALGLENQGHRRFIACIGGQTIDCLGGQTHQLTALQGFKGLHDGLRQFSV